MHNQDKENVRPKTRIPVPLAPLPALPKYLLMRSSKRPALNTLSGPNHNVPSSNLLRGAGPSEQNKSVGIRTKTVILDTKFVTFRRGCGINNRYPVPRIVITVPSDDEENHENENDNNGLANNDGPRLNTLFPDYGVKNIKKSLKRPHSTDLQGLNRKRSDRAKSRLIFNETVNERMQSPDLVQKSYMASLAEEDDTPEILSYLLKAEKKPTRSLRIQSETRARFIDWLMKVNGTAGNPATVQTAVWYMDAVLASVDLTLERKQLVTAAAYWLAAKLHGSAYLISASKIVKYANFNFTLYNFTVQKLLEAEKFILLTLRFPRQPIVPQDYLYYFAWWCNNERPGEIEVASTFICHCGMMVNMSLYLEYPSVVAAASIRTALSLLKKKALIPLLKECPAYAAAEKKAENISNTCTILRDAVCVIGAKEYSHKFLIRQYGPEPKYIAQTLVSAATSSLTLYREETNAPIQ